MGDALHKVNLGARPAIALTAGKNHACALLDDGSAKCWGSAENGQLGNGGPTPWLYIGDSPNELGENLKPVALGTAHTATAIAAGEQSTCAVLEDRISVKCWAMASTASSVTGAMPSSETIRVRWAMRCPSCRSSNGAANSAPPSAREHGQERFGRVARCEAQGAFHLMAARVAGGEHALAIRVRAQLFLPR